MADTVLTQVQLEDIFQSLTSQLLGTTDPSAVRITWPKDGAPSWSIDDDVCFVSVTPSDNSYTRQLQTDYSPLDQESLNSTLAYTAGVRVSWTLYGPNSSDNADLIRATLFSDSTKSTLISNDLALITDVPMPIRQPELFNGEWWNRATLYADFNHLVKRQSTVPYLQSADVLVSADVEIKEG
ncbi:phage neck terminator protein [Alicyclobacillus suci]|uniref:phage neck terminator protein n=1 Tax=Alicyclobacillus suci TaxID=2816080 RepID=UPI001A8E3B56|nr:hypothetical protein [Alicyclobacillus suci]